MFIAGNQNTRTINMTLRFTIKIIERKICYLLVFVVFDLSQVQMETCEKFCLLCFQSKK